MIALSWQANMVGLFADIKTARMSIRKQMLVIGSGVEFLQFM